MIRFNLTATRPHGHTATRPHGHTATRPHGHTATRPHGHTATRPHGHTATRPKSWALVLLGLFTFSCNLCFSQQPWQVTQLVESHRAKMIVFYNVEDDYVEFEALMDANQDIQFPCGVDDPSTTTQDESFWVSVPNSDLPLNSTIHQRFPRTLNALTGVRVVSRHGFRTHGTRRPPFCITDDLLTGFDETELYYNNTLLIDEACNETVTNFYTSAQQPFFEATVSSFHNNVFNTNTNNPLPGQVPMEVMAYHNLSGQFVFEIQQPTGQLGLLDWTGSTCLCQTMDGFDNNDDNGQYNFDPFNIGLEDPHDPATTLTYGLIADNNVCPFSHYLCTNCPDWRNRTMARVRRIAQSGADYLSIDEWAMPNIRRGCYCNNCRNVFSQNPNFCPSGNCNLDYTNSIDSTLWGRRHLHADFMNFTARTLAADVQANIAPARLVYSVAFLTNLDDDQYRTDVASVIDIPKTEFSMPLRNGRNILFRGSLFENEGVSYGSLLYKYRIPEDIRVAAGLAVVRDASRTRLAHVWLPQDGFRENGVETGNNHSVWNNLRYRTLLGASYAYGVIMANTFGTPIGGLNSVQIKDNPEGLSLWDVSRNYTWSAGIPNIQNLNPQAQSGQIEPIYDLDDRRGTFFANRRPYSWVSVYFSERERNRYLYLSDDIQNNVAPTSWNLLQQAASPNPVTTNLSQQRNALAYINVLMPFFAGFEAVYNCKLEGPDDVWVKYPVACVNDNQIAVGNLLGSNALIVPASNKFSSITYPINSNVSEFAGFYHPTTFSQLAAINRPRILVGYNQDHPWYLGGQNNLHDLNQIRQSVENELAGPPPVYVIGKGANAGTVHAGFFIRPDLFPNQDNSLTVALSIQPIWGQPRETTEVVYDTDPVVTAQYPETPLIVDQNEIVICLRVGGPFLPNLSACSTVIAQVMDASLSGPDTFVTGTLFNAPSGPELRFSMPAFAHFLVVHFPGCN